MNKHIKLIVTVIAITSILCCVPVASAVDATEPTEAPAVTVQAIEHEAICCILLAIGIPSGCMIAQGFSFWKW